MKYKFCILFFCVCFLQPLLLAQEVEPESPTWRVIQLPLDDEKIMGVKIGLFMEEGFYPVGLEVQGEDTIAVFGERRSFSPGRYYLQYFKDIETLPADFAAFLDAGWSPAGATFFREGFLALFIESDARLRAWRMLPVEGRGPLEQQGSINRLVASALEDGLEPFALSRWQEDLMIGFVTAHRFVSPTGSYIIENYPNDGVSLVEGINGRLAEGYGISGYHFHEKQLYIGFFK